MDDREPFVGRRTNVVIDFLKRYDNWTTDVPLSFDRSDEDSPESIACDLMDR